MSPPSDDELNSYPHVQVTSDMPWEPFFLDDEYPVSDMELSEDDVVTPSYHSDS
jgi:hypothetical protein